MKIKIVKISNPSKFNLILGQSHFIKTVEDLHEVIAGSVPGAKFGLAFSEASGPCLIRTSGTDKELVKLAANNLKNIGAGHCFLIFLKECFPINILPGLKNVPEVVVLYCATANPVEVITIQTEQGRAILGAVDGYSPKGVEKQQDLAERKRFLRDIGYKL